MKEQTPNDDVKKVVNFLEKMEWIDPETTFVYEDHFILYQINSRSGEDFDFLDSKNYLKIDVVGEDDDTPEDQRSVFYKKQINLHINGIKKEKVVGRDEDFQIVWDYIRKKWGEYLERENIKICW
jgi:hypothetical protein